MRLVASHVDIYLSLELTISQTDAEAECFRQFSDALNSPGIKVTLNIKTETELLEEIKDIRDELNIIVMVFKEQKNVLDGLIQHIKGYEQGGGGIEQGGHHRSSKLLSTVEQQIREVEAIDKHAERIYFAVGILKRLTKVATNFIS
jgi:hypothetical protein